MTYCWDLRCVLMLNGAAFHPSIHSSPAIDEPEPPSPPHTQLKCPDRLRKEAAVVAIAQLLEAGDAEGEEATATNTVCYVAWVYVLD